MDSAPVDVRTLPNGMRVARLDLPERRMFSLDLVLPGGALHERDDEWGLAHLVEHVVMRGTQRYGDRVATRRVASSLGAYLNAATSYRRVAIRLNGLAERAPEMLDLAVEIATAPRMDRDDATKEADVVAQEILRSLDSDADRANRLLWRAAYGDRAGRSILGDEESVRSFTPEDITEFWRRGYIADGALLVLAGDTSALPDEAVDRMLGRFAAGSRAVEPVDMNGPLVDGTTHRAPGTSGQANLRLVVDTDWRFDDGQRARMARNILRAILDQRVGEEIRSRRRLVYSAGAGMVFPHQRVRLLVTAGCAPERAEEALRVMRETVREIAVSPEAIEDEELESVRAGLMTGFSRDSESTNGVCDGVSATLQGDSAPLHLWSALETLAEIDRDDLAEAARGIVLDREALVSVGGPDDLSL